jgi:thiol-disulfide isomerase/thioredoxin
MRMIARRALLLAAGTVSAGTVAAATLLRKPATPPIATLVADTPEKLPDVSGVIPADPPRAPAPIRFTDADGASHGLDEYRGKTVVLNLWATWCQPCVMELPSLAALARRGASEGIVVLPLSSDRGGARVVRRFYAAHGITDLPALLDPKGEAARAWGARGLPTTLILDAQGRERARLEGSADWSSDTSLAVIRQLVG